MQGMRDMLRGSLRGSLRDLSPEDRLSAAWPIACGRALSAHGAVERLDDAGILHVAVDGQDWIQSFLSMRSALANDLAQIAGVPLRGIHFEVKRHT